MPNNKNRKSTSNRRDSSTSRASSIVSAGEHAKQLIKAGLVRQMSAQFESTAHSTNYQSQNLKFDKLRLQHVFGYLNQLLNNVTEEATIVNVIATIRAKTWGQINTLHIDAVFKGTGIADKSAKASSAEAGLVVSGHNLPNAYFEDIDMRRATDYSEYGSEVYPLPIGMTDAYGNAQFVTFPSQTIATIEARIASGYYSDVRTYVNENGIFIREFNDALGGEFIIEYDPAKFTEIGFVTGSPVTVRQRQKLFNATVERKDSSAKRKRSSDHAFDMLVKKVPIVEVYKSAGDKKRVLDTEKTEYITYDSYVGLEKLIATSGDQAVTLRRRRNPTPYVICSDKGKFMKGDVDLQDSMLPSDLPLMAYKFINLNKANKKDGDLAINDIESLINVMREFDRQLEAIKNYNSVGRDKYSKLQKYVLAACKNLQRIQKERKRVSLNNTSETALNPINTDEVILKEIGMVDLLNAILIFARQDGRLHGADAASPVYPENILATHIPSVIEPGKYIATHGEYEYVKELLRNQEFVVNESNVFHLKSFNLCHLHTNQAWRENVTDTVCDINGVMHHYRNKDDEIYSVKMHRLLLERQLLRCRLYYGETRYEEYIKILRRNFELTIMNIKYKDDKRKMLLDNMLQGLAVAKAIMRDVDKCADIPARLQQIAEITNHTDDSVIRKNLDGIPLEIRNNSKRDSSIIDAAYLRLNSKRPRTDI